MQNRSGKIENKRIIFHDAQIINFFFGEDANIICVISNGFPIYCVLKEKCPTINLKFASFENRFIRRNIVEFLHLNLVFSIMRTQYLQYIKVGNSVCFVARRNKNNNSAGLKTSVALKAFNK